MKTSHHLIIAAASTLLFSNVAFASMVPVSISHELISSSAGTDITSTGNFGPYDMSTAGNSQTTTTTSSNIFATSTAQNGSSRFSYEFTASNTGTYQYNYSTSGVDTGSFGSTDPAGGWMISIFDNGIDLLNVNLETYGAPTGSDTRNGTISVNAGDTIDVGVRADSDQLYYTSTASLTVSEVPLPSTLTLFLSSFFIVPMKLRRKFKSVSNTSYQDHS